MTALAPTDVAEKLCLDWLAQMAGVWPRDLANVPFAPEDGTPYLRPRLNISVGDMETLGSKATSIAAGLFVIEMRVANGSGQGELRPQNGAIQERFKFPLALQSGKVTVRFIARPSLVGEGADDATWYSRTIGFPVRVWVNA